MTIDHVIPTRSCHIPAHELLNGPTPAPSPREVVQSHARPSQMRQLLESAALYKPLADTYIEPPPFDSIEEAQMVDRAARRAQLRQMLSVELDNLYRDISSIVNSMSTIIAQMREVA